MTAEFFPVAVLLDFNYIYEYFGLFMDFGVYSSFLAPFFGTSAILRPGKTILFEAF